MTRRQYRFDPMKSGYKGAPRWPDPYHCEWGVIVGDRIRRLRRDRDMTLVDLSRVVDKPDGGHYTPGFFSRLERGWSSGPLVTYVNVAYEFGVEPGRLLGPDDAQLEVSESEMTLVRVLRRMGLRPDEAIARLAGLVSEAEADARAGRPGRAGSAGDTVFIDDAGLAG
jgi:transcriptional regulator with XRE-family HTH domain